MKYKVNKIKEDTKRTNTQVRKIFEHIKDIRTRGDLKRLITKNPNKLIIGQVNFNSIRNKFEMLTLHIQENIDILMIIETKLYNAFTTGQFLKNGLKQLFCVYQNWNGDENLRQKGESQNRCFKKTKHVKFSEKTNISNPQIRTRFEIRPFALLPTIYHENYWL